MLRRGSQHCAIDKTAELILIAYAMVEVFDGRSITVTTSETTRQPGTSAEVDDESCLDDPAASRPSIISSHVRPAEKVWTWWRSVDEYSGEDTVLDCLRI
jgi:hypothetical protein